MQRHGHLSLEEIEKKYDTQSISYFDSQVWPVLRFKIGEEIRRRGGIKPRTINLNWRTYINLLGSLFYGIGQLFRIGQYQYWAFSASERRKKIHGKYKDRVIGVLSDEYPSTLIIENPMPLGRHLKKNILADQHVLGQTILFAITKLITLFYIRNPKIKNEKLLIKILEENDLINIDYRNIIRNFYAQYQLMKFLIGRMRPKAVFFVYSASSMGYIKALKQKCIPVIEMQHGIINKSHMAYNLYKDFGSNLLPDYLLTYGQMELEIFGSKNYFIDRECVFPVGYYFLEEMINAPLKDAPLGTLKEKFEKIIVFSLQDPFEEYIFEFLKKTAALNEKVCYLLVPRIAAKLYPEIQNVRNLIVSREMNIYECLKIADFHATINSTCAIESLCFGVPNILFNYNNWAFNYYGGILNDTGHTVFIETPHEFINILEGHNFQTKAEIEKKSSVFIKRDYTQNIKEVLEKIILEKADE